MKWIIWTVGGVLAAIWTGALALATALLDWAGSALRQAGPESTSWPSLPPELPSWLAGWIEPARWETISQAMHQALQAAQSTLPAIGTATGWLGPLLWTVWGVGLAGLLALAATLHWLVNRRAR